MQPPRWNARGNVPSLCLATSDHWLLMEHVDKIEMAGEDATLNCMKVASSFILDCYRMDNLNNQDVINFKLQLH